MLRSIAQNLLTFSLQILKQRLGLLFLTGWICGLFVLSCVQRYQAFVSDSPEVMAGIGLAIVVGIWLGLPASISLSKLTSESTRNRTRIQFSLLVLSLWSVCFPLLLNQLNQILHLITVQQMSNFVFLTGLMILTAMALIMPAVFWSSRLFWFTARRSVNQFDPVPRLSQHIARFLAGVGVAMITATCWIVPQFGWNLALVLPVILALLVSFGPWLMTYFKEYLPALPLWLKIESHKTETDLASSPSSESDQREQSTVSPFLLRSGSYLMSLAVGILFITLSRVLFQLYPDSLYLKVTIWAAFFTGIATAFAFIRARSAAQLSRATAGLTLGTALLGVGCLALFPLFVSGMLRANAYIEYALVLALVRGGFTAVIFSLLGVCWGGWLTLSLQSQLSKNEETPIVPLPVWQPFCFLAGMLCSFWLLGSSLAGIKSITVLTSLALLCLSAIVWFSQQGIPRTRLQRAISICGLSALTLSLIFHHNYDARHSAKMLFSTNTFTGLRYGLKPEMLPHLDEGRCLSEIDGEYGTFTLWSYRENQIQIRRSGLPFGVTSVDPGLCPHTTGELMPFLIPVILHERPADVLFLGLGSGVGVNASLDFPVQHVTCLEPDNGLVKLYQEEIAPRNSISAFQSERVQLNQLPIALAMAARSEAETRYDLIISNPVQSVVTQSQAEYTAEFYRNVSRHLDEDGIFCQRFQHIDFGAQPLRVVAQTFLSEFKQVMALEIANGETLFLATNSDLGFIRKNLIDRIQAPQVRRTLAQVGWDWSVLLNLAAYSADALYQMTLDVKTSINNTSTGTFAFTLPYEVMRWGPKRREVQQMISQKDRTGRLINWMHNEKEDPIVLRRLSEVTAQNKLMAQYPDQYWKYRKPAKDQITENPRSLIKQVAAEGLTKDDYIHDEDKRRMLYFKALSDAMEKADPSVEMISRVIRFTSTYDPMISYFMHDEVAELYKKSTSAPPKMEFAHRLHALNYGAGSDRSINSVVRAIELAATKPELFLTKDQQWDHLNGLLQALKTRWDNRSQARPVTSKQALHDIELSISAIEMAFKTMADIHAEVGISEEDWRLRKLVLDRTLVRPLETYHDRVLPHHYKKKGKEAKKLLDNLNLPDASSL
ncbi:hypothetical protein [uncultured Gimesia sp.]|uniref:spermine/spermidine synthase domain-containing protein n=1 Tax=uncultured Gimesia sp. TaxID=1678688 RepID=UPI0030DB7775|tara:strand:- start:25801 stop:29142 length:3342 start_codon:yes stop_codon:yes gene_type:complete